MLLAIDVGNTQTHIGAFDGPSSSSTGGSRPTARRPATSSRRRHTTCSACAASDSTDIDGEAVSSVVPHLVSEYRHMFERYLEHEALIVGPGTKTGMPIRLDNPRELGADRLVNAVAGYDHCGDACVIVDFGTAITYDAVSASRRVPRGASSARASRSRSRRSTSRAARLTKVDIAEPRALIGKSTEAAIQSGIVYGFAAQVDGICARLRRELGDGMTTIATGGLQA